METRELIERDAEGNETPSDSGKEDLNIPLRVPIWATERNRNLVIGESGSYEAFTTIKRSWWMKPPTDRV